MSIPTARILPKRMWSCGADGITALVTALLFLGFHAATGFPTLSDLRGDNDSLMRLVQVRDLIGGQGWFDLSQYRMGPEGGFTMHWSRLVDAPVAAIVLAGSALTGSVALGEAAALILWPALLFGLTLFFIVRAARLFGGEQAVLPSVVLGAAALHFVGIYAPGALDHHNVQLTLTAASLCFLMEASEKRGRALLSGACAALMLAVGMETAPYVAALGLCAAGLFLFGGRGDRLAARDFGTGFAGVSALAFFATVPAANWFRAQCDAFSIVQFAVAALAGTGLAAMASMESATATRGGRLLAIASLGVSIGALVVFMFPQCISGPYSMFDERMRELWLDHVSEAKPLLTLLYSEPGKVLARYATPFIGLISMAVSLRGRNWRRQDVLVGAVFAMAFAVSIWQVRGSTFSIAFAVIPLSAWVGGWRLRAGASRSGWVSAKMAAVWLLSLNASWAAAAGAAAFALEGSAASPTDNAASACEREQDFATLASLPKATVLSVSNLGSAILAYSGHHAIAGPYHRNLEGNRMVLDVSMGSPEEAKAIMERHKVGLLAICPGNPESSFLAKRAPEGFLAAMLNGAAPAWLEPVKASQTEPLKLYRISPGS